jgi:uncharacterized protein (TIGR03066 family)
MSRFQLLATGTLTCLLIGSVPADEPKGSPDIPKLLIGKWQVTSANRELPIGSTFEFNKDGKMKLTRKEGDRAITADAVYTLEGDKLRFTLKFEDKEEKKGPITIKKISEQELVLDAGGLTLELKRMNSTSPKPPTFEVPKGWKTVNATSLTSARFEIGEGERLATVIVAGLAGDGGGLAANVNRWRAQLELPALAEKDVLESLKPIKVDGIAGHFIDLTGPEVVGKSPTRILGVIVKQGEHTWYFKLTGPANLVGDQKAAFEGFLKSVRFAK